MGPAPAPSNSRGTHHSPGRTNRVTITGLLCATPGSAGLDFSASTQYALTPEIGTQTIPTGVYGPLPEGTIGLILGKNSLTLKGLQIHPGVID
jgi:dUTPase